MLNSTMPGVVAQSASKPATTKGLHIFHHYAGKPGYCRRTAEHQQQELSWPNEQAVLSQHVSRAEADRRI
jgi:hypothetical protein